MSDELPPLEAREAKLPSTCNLAAAGDDNMSEPTEQTNSVEEDVEQVMIDVDTEEVDFNHGRLTEIRGLEELRRIRVLGFRNNLLKKIENLETLTTLVELEFYDNQVRK